VFTAVDRLVAEGALAAMPTYFEVSTAAAFLIFAEAHVDVAVVEVGLGGRFDATNVLTPVAGAITTIDFDHERHLGTTLAAIAAEKAGIAKPGVPLVVGEVGDEAWAAIDASARRAGAPVTRAHDGLTAETALVDGHARLTVTTPAGHYGPVRPRLRRARGNASGHPGSRGATGLHVDGAHRGLPPAAGARRLEC
jgi:folylpolyglutamate synthase/dihydrofolate synthase